MRDRVVRSCAICVPLDERLRPPFQSLCCSASPLQADDTTRRSRSWLPGWRRCTEAHDGQPPARFGLRQLSTGHACLTLRGREAVAVAPAATASHAVRCLCLDDGTPCTESFTLQLPSDLAAGSSMRCSSNFRLLQSNYSGTVPPVGSSVVPWTMHPAPVFAAHAQIAAAVMASNLPSSPCPCARYGAKLSSWGSSRRVMARLPSMNFLLWTLPAGANPIHPRSPSLDGIMAP
jgi:hypothetical protein